MSELLVKDLIPSLTLIGAAIGIVTVLGTLAWCWMKFSLRNRKQYRRW